MHEQAVRCGWRSTIGYWTAPSDTPQDVVEKYVSASRVIREKSLDSYISVKAPAFNYDFGLLMEVLDVAKESGHRVHFDAMSPDSVPPTFSLIERALKTHRNLGCTLPARWGRSTEDTGRVIEWAIPVRIVKGQWPDPSVPGLDPRAQYLKIIGRLSGKAAHVAVATHDRAVAREALRVLSETGTPCEMEQLSSLPQNCARLAKGYHIPLRVYVPYGYPSMPYDIWQVRARPQIINWVLRDILVGTHRHLHPVR